MGRRWTEPEELWLEQVYSNPEIPMEVMAHALKRSVYGIQSKAFVNGLTERGSISITFLHDGKWYCALKEDGESFLLGVA